MRSSMTPESQLCECTKNVLFSSMRVMLVRMTLYLVGMIIADLWKEDIKKEVEKLRNLLYHNNSKLIYESQSSENLWLENNKEYPYLSKLALVLSNINSSSAFIERFVSICGFVQDKRKMNIIQDLFITRCLLRANIKILNELREIKKQ